MVAQHSSGQLLNSLQCYGSTDRDERRDSSCSWIHGHYLSSLAQASINRSIKSRAIPGQPPGNVARTTTYKAELPE